MSALTLVVKYQQDKDSISPPSPMSFILQPKMSPAHKENSIGNHFLKA